MRSSTLRRRVSLGTAAAALGVGLSALSAHPAAAQTTVYSDTTTFGGQAFSNGGATAATPTTAMVADDITPIAGFAGDQVTAFTFSFANLNTTSVTAAPTVNFYLPNPDPTSGAPGTLLTSVVFNPITQAAGSVGLFTATSTKGFFTLPTTEPNSGVAFWAGISFSGATPALLNNLGQGLYNAPTVGSSQDVFFQSSAPATTAGNPAGGLFYFGGTPVANFGWSFSVTPPPAVPEASTTVSLGLMLALGMGGLVIASKRKKASAKA